VPDEAEDVEDGDPFAVPGVHHQVEQVQEERPDVQEQSQYHHEVRRIHTSELTIMKHIPINGLSQDSAKEENEADMERDLSLVLIGEVVFSLIKEGDLHFHSRHGLVDLVELLLAVHNHKEEDLRHHPRHDRNELALSVPSLIIQLHLKNIDSLAPSFCAGQLFVLVDVVEVVELVDAHFYLGDLVVPLVAPLQLRLHLCIELLQRRRPKLGTVLPELSFEILLARRNFWRS